MSALVHPHQGRSWLCTIRDFCEDGMLLIGTGGSRSLLMTGADLGCGDAANVHFSVPTPTGDLHFRLPAQVARILDGGSGMGIAFRDGLPERAFAALMDFAVASGTVLAPDPGAETAAADDGDIPENLLRDHRISERDAAALRAQLRRVMKQAAERIMRSFFEKAEQDLIVKARDAGTNATQMMYFEGLDQLERNQKGIEQRFAESVLRQIDQVSDLNTVLEQRRRRETSSSGKLELVDTEEFEEWLAVAEVISKSEGRFSDILFDIRSRLGMLAKPWGHKDVVPVGPAALGWSFDAAIEVMDLRRQVRLDVFKVFERALIPLLSNLYEAISTLLEESGVFPSVESIRESIRRTPIVGRRPTGDPGGYQHMEPSVREAAMAADGVATASPNDNPFAPRGGDSAKVYKAARELLNLGRRTRRALGHSDDMRFAAPDASPDQRYATDDILAAMSVVEREMGDAPLADMRLKSRLMEVLKSRHGDRKAFLEEQYDALDVMESLVDSLRQDHLLTEGARDWIRRLEITLNKLATRDPEFLSYAGEDPHTAAQVLNQLARLGNARDVRVGIDRDVGRQVDVLMERIVREYDQNPRVFDEVLGELNPLVDRQVRAYRGNIERTVRASEGQQKLARARRAVIDEMDERLAGRDVPELLLALLNPGWRNLLVHNHLRHGRDSNEWRDALAIVDEVQAQLSGKSKPGDSGYVDPEALLKRIVAGLNSISYEPGKRTPLVMALQSALVGDTTGAKTKVELVPVGADDIAEALGLTGVVPETDPAIETDDDAVRASWSSALERSRRIRVGEWLAMADREGRPLILTIAFIGDDYTNFVLVNRKGIKVRDLPLKEMADGLNGGQITLLGDYDLPLMERASQRMLENMHQQLAYQASHDELTDLLNRREFERVLEKAITEAKAGSLQHALLYIDMDQFKIINNTSGHSAGDALLKSMGGELIGAMRERDATVARLGGDEFGVLLREIETQAARDLASDLLDRIRAQKFDWEGRHYSLSASIGLVFIDQTTESVDSSMRHADEACYSAKDAGRNRVQEYELGDARMMRRHGVMEWVAELDKALDEGRLVLNCQRIVPIQNGIEAHRTRAESHYEILLTLRDSDGDVMPPSEFIFAAETYNRMTAIDRWVIENVLTWMADHRRALDDFSGFSVNVSGHSINDETFADFVLECFSRTQTPTGKICFEITETAAIANLDNAVDFMNRMKIIGCRFSLDDFGTGLSSYSYLRNLPVDFVKIDGVFVKDLASSPGDYAVVRSINEIGHYMGKRTIAEYVESNEILEQLREIGVDFAQGYGIEKPILLTDLRA